MNQLQVIAIFTLFAAAACGNSDRAVSQANERSPECSAVLEQGLVYIFARGWDVDSLQQMTIDFDGQDPVSGHYISHLEVLEIQDSFYQLSFPSDTKLGAVANYVGFLKSGDALQAADDDTMVVALFRVLNLIEIGEYGIVAAYAPADNMDKGVIEIITTDGTIYHHFTGTNDGALMGSRSTPEDVQQFLDDWGFTKCS